MSLWKRVRGIMKKPEPPKQEKTVRDLLPGDICEVSLITYEVSGRTEWRSRALVWYTLRDGSDVRYLRVEQRERLDIAIYNAIDGRLDAVDEVPSEIELDGTWYFLDDHYNGFVQTQGQTPFGVNGEQHAWEYQADNRKRLRIVWHDGRFGLYEGESVLSADVRIIRHTS